jgi:hypothetical protein
VTEELARQAEASASAEVEAKAAVAAAVAEAKAAAEAAAAAAAAAGAAEAAAAEAAERKAAEAAAAAAAEEAAAASSMAAANSPANHAATSMMAMQAKVQQEMMSIKQRLQVRVRLGGEAFHALALGCVGCLWELECAGAAVECDMCMVGGARVVCARASASHRNLWGAVSTQSSMPPTQTSLAALGLAADGAAVAGGPAAVHAAPADADADAAAARRHEPARLARPRAAAHVAAVAGAHVRRRVAAGGHVQPAAAAVLLHARQQHMAADDAAGASRGPVAPVEKGGCKR